MTKPHLPPFWRLVEDHADELLAHARRLAGRDAAEDIVQDALLKALHSYDRLQHADHLRAWLYRVTTTTAFDHGSKKARTAEIPVAQVPAPGVWQGPDDGGFEALIEPLPQAAKTVLTMRFVDDLSYDAIATKLGCSNDAARQRVSSAVRTLRKSRWMQ